VPAVRLFVLTPLLGIVAVVALTIVTTLSEIGMLVCGAGVAGVLAGVQERLRRRLSMPTGLVALGAASMFVVETAALLLFLFHDFES
jgi:hypothetical protein